MMGPRREKAVSKATTADTLCASRCAIFLFYQALPVFLANAAGLPVKSFVSLTCMNRILHHKREKNIRECPNSGNILISRLHNCHNLHRYGAFLTIQIKPPVSLNEAPGVQCHR